MLSLLINAIYFVPRIPIEFAKVHRIIFSSISVHRLAWFLPVSYYVSNLSCTTDCKIAGKILIICANIICGSRFIHRHSVFTSIHFICKKMSCIVWKIIYICSVFSRCRINFRVLNRIINISNLTERFNLYFYCITLVYPRASSC